MKLQCREVSFSYSDEPFLQNINLSFSNEDGCIVLLGRNGAGKSTLLNVISEQLPYCGKIIKEDARMLFLPYEDALIANLSVEDNLAFFYRIFHKRKLSYADEKLQEILTALSITYLKQKINICSSGQKKKVALACLLLSNANVFLLDEPFNAIDYQSVNELIALFNKWKQEKLFIITTHSFSLASQFCDRLLVLEAGNLIKDTINKEDIIHYLQGKDI